MNPPNHLAGAVLTILAGLWPSRVAPVPAPVKPPPPVHVVPVPVPAPVRFLPPVTPSQPAPRPPAQPSAPPLPPAVPAVPAGRCPAGMADIPGGTFMMGADDGEDDEKPARAVTVGPFCLDVTEVTVAAYARCPTCRAPAEGDLCNAPGTGKDDHPQNCVSWNDAVAFCTLSGKRLPTEAQWELAARGGARQLRWPWGARPPTPQSACWNRWDPNDRGTCAVGSSPEGAFGLKDMAGNVLEWVADWYGPDEPVPGAPEKIGMGAGRVIRGGAWTSSSSSDLRGTRRAGLWPTNRDDYLGFRCAL